MLCQGMLFPGAGILLGLSGGADSVALLRILVRLREKYGLRLAAAHVHHGIRGAEAERDAAFCRALCGKFDIPMILCRPDVPAIAAEQHLSEEEAGRKVRYALFETIRREKRLDFTAVAHHMEDQAETLLFRMIRGSSIRGLSGMKPVQGRVIRPLLTFSRQEIEDFLREEGQDFVTDSTNGDSRYARNRIRNRIFPEMEQINAGAVSHIAALAADLSEAQDLVEENAAVLEKQIISPDPRGIRIEVAGLLQADMLTAGEVILRCLTRLSGHRKDLTREHISAVRNLAAAETGSCVSLPYGMKGEKIYGEILLTREAEKHDSADTDSFPAGSLRMEILPRIPGVLPRGNPYTKVIDYAKIRNTLRLRYPLPGDRVAVGGGHKKLSKFFTDEKIPARQRRTWPVVADGQDIVWVVGMRLSEAYYITEKTKQAAKLSCLLKGEENEYGGSADSGGKS